MDYKYYLYDWKNRLPSTILGNTLIQEGDLLKYSFTTDVNQRQILLGEDTLITTQAPACYKSILTISTTFSPADIRGIYELDVDSEWVGGAVAVLIPDGGQQLRSQTGYNGFRAEGAGSFNSVTGRFHYEGSCYNYGSLKSEEVVYFVEFLYIKSRKTCFLTIKKALEHLRDLTKVTKKEP